MPRSRGTRNPDYETKRRLLLQKVRERLSAPDLSRASLRELAAAGGVTFATLRHYFNGREELISDILREGLRDGGPYLSRMSVSDGPFAQSIRNAVFFLAQGFRHAPLGEFHALGLSEGLRNQVVGPAFVEYVLEPSICAIAARLDAHVTAGDMRPCDTRHAALALLSPIVLSFLHQAELGGARRHPLDIDDFLEDHAAAFVRAHAIPATAEED